MSAAEPSSLYCGNPPMRAGRLFRRDPEGGISKLLENRRIYWSFNTRVAIRAACDLLGLGPGDEVLAPAYNCGSELDPLVHAGLSVRLYPVSRDLRADPGRIEALIGPRTRAVYVTHYFGILQPGLADLRALCDRHGLRMIEDCALSLLSGAAPVEGRTGDAAVFCFYKFVPVLQGGALAINAPDLTAGTPFPHPPPRLRVAREIARAGLSGAAGQGRLQALKRRLRRRAAPASEPSGRDHGLEDIPGHYYFDPALQGTRISAFAARPLRAFSVSGMIAARRRNWQIYRELLDGIPGIGLLTPALAAETCPLNMPVLIQDRDRVAHALQARGIGVTPWWAGFNRNLNWSGQAEAMDLKNTVLSLPLHQSLGAAHLEHITAQLRQAL